MPSVEDVHGEHTLGSVSSGDVRYAKEELAAGAGGSLDVHLQRLCLKEEAWVRENLAQNENLAEDVQRVLVHDSSRLVREWLGSNTCILPELLLVLASDIDDGVVDAVAYNPSTPVETQAKLSFDVEVGYWLRRNKGLVLTGDFSARFCMLKSTDFFYDALPVSSESDEWDALIFGWEGSLKALGEALMLLGAPPKGTP